MEETHVPGKGNAAVINTAWLYPDQVKAAKYP